MPVIWNLSYPVATPDQFAVFRHHFETLTQDAHVATVYGTENERAGRPNVMTIRVEFANGFERPDSHELRYADQLYPSQEQDIEVGTPEQAQETLRRLQFEMPRIGGLSAAEAQARLRSVMDALRVPDLTTIAHALGPGAGGYTEPVTLPKWIAVGCAYQLKNPTDGRRALHIVTLKAVRVNPGNIKVEVTTLDGLPHLYILDEFVNLFEPYERRALLKTAWDHVLEDDD